MNRRKITAKQGKILSDKKLIQLAAGSQGVIKSRIIPPSEIVTAQWVRLKCRYGCDGYGQSLVCPPFSPTADQTRAVLDSYKRAMLIHFKPQADVKAAILELEHQIFFAGVWKTIGFGAGPCYLCKTCILKEGRCRHPEHARPSMEACGIDVFSTVRKSGFPIQVLTATKQRPNYYGLVLID